MPRIPYSSLGALITTAGFRATTLLKECLAEVERVGTLSGLLGIIEKDHIASKLQSIESDLEGLKRHAEVAHTAGYSDLANEARTHISLISEGLKGLKQRMKEVGLA